MGETSICSLVFNIYFAGGSWQKAGKPLYCFSREYHE